jgi:hypothetical protein
MASIPAHNVHSCMYFVNKKIFMSSEWSLVPQLKFRIQREIIGLGVVVHTCNSNYTGEKK